MTETVEELKIYKTEEFPTRDSLEKAIKDYVKDLVAFYTPPYDKRKPRADQEVEKLVDEGTNYPPKKEDITTLPFEWIDKTEIEEQQEEMKEKFEKEMAEEKEKEEKAKKEAETTPSKNYAQYRQEEYNDVTDQLDALLKTFAHLQKNGVNIGEEASKLVEHHQSVKQKYPKPT